MLRGVLNVTDLFILRSEKVHFAMPRFPPRNNYCWLIEKVGKCLPLLYSCTLIQFPYWSTIIIVTKYIKMIFVEDKTCSIFSTWCSITQANTIKTIAHIYNKRAIFFYLIYYVIFVECSKISIVVFWKYCWCRRSIRIEA